MQNSLAVVVPSRVASNGDCEGLPTIILEALSNSCLVIQAKAYTKLNEIMSKVVQDTLNFRVVAPKSYQTLVNTRKEKVFQV